jgi:uncharacterized membrane-anchored protein YhcB (DUF1043 family)
MRRSTFWAVLLIALAAGFFLGYVIRAWRHPTLEERTEDAAKDMRRALDRFTR